MLVVCPFDRHYFGPCLLCVTRVLARRQLPTIAFDRDSVSCHAYPQTRGLATALDRKAPPGIADTQAAGARAGQDEVQSSLNSPETKDGSYIAHRRGRGS